MTGDGANHGASYDSILAERARVLAEPDEGVGDRAIHATVVVVVVGEQRFGIDTEYLCEVIPLGPVHWLPALPACVRGLALVRSEVVAVIDVARWFAVSGNPQPKLLAVIEGEPGRLALQVDRVEEVRRIYTDELVEADELGIGEGRRLVRATTRDLLAVLHVPRLLESNEVRLRPREGSAGAREGSAEP